MKISPGKLAGMKAVSDTRGVIAAAAMDQRGSLQKALAKERGGAVGDQEMEEFKILVAEVLTEHASAILLDPEWGIPASKRRAKDSGPADGVQEDRLRRRDARTPARLLDLWSVRRIKDVGADCVKILLYYAPADPQKVNDHKHAWVERIGDECRANDIPFFLEVIAYEDGLDEKGLEFAEKTRAGRRLHARVHEGSLRRRRAESGSPGQHEVRRGDEGVRRHQRLHKPQAKDWFRKTADVTTRPFIYLSAGVSNPEFCETLELAGEAGTRFSGVLCGRATWKDGIPIYAKQGAGAFRAWLETKA